MMKYFRSEGYDVCILPDDDQPVEYLFKKGVKEFFSDPLNVILSGIPFTIVTTLFTNFLQKLIDKNQSKDVPVNINIQNLHLRFGDDSYLVNGEKVSNSKLLENLDYHEKLKHEFEKRFKMLSPYSQFPLPIYLEHNPYIVGWCALGEDDKGMMLDGKLTDKVVFKRVQQGRYKGLSVTGIAKRAICSICGDNYVSCIHISGTVYNGENCTNKIIKSDFVEASIVKQPVNEQCLFNLK